MALNPSNSSNLEQLALKGLITKTSFSSFFSAHTTVKYAISFHSFFRMVLMCW